MFYTVSSCVDRPWVAYDVDVASLWDCSVSTGLDLKTGVAIAWLTLDIGSA